MLIDLSNTTQLDNLPRWHPLKEQSEIIHGRANLPQGGGGSGGQGGPGGPGGPGGLGGPGGTKDQSSSEQSHKTSVIKSRSHGIFPDPAKGSNLVSVWTYLISVWTWGDGGDVIDDGDDTVPSQTPGSVKTLHGGNFIIGWMLGWMDWWVCEWMY